MKCLEERMTQGPNGLSENLELFNQVRMKENMHP